MHKKLTIIISLAVVVCLVSIVESEIRVTKVLETRSVREYNQWVKANKGEYPELRPIYITAEQIKRTREKKGWSEEYKIQYFDEDGNLTREELVKGYVTVKVSPFFDEVMVIERDKPMYPTKRIVKIKDRYGNTLFQPKLYSIIFTGADVYLEDRYPEGLPSHPSIRVFDRAGTVLNELSDVGCYSSFPSISNDHQYFVLGAATGPGMSYENLILIDNKGNEIFRKKFLPDPITGVMGIHPVISGNGTLIAVGYSDTVYLYNKTGALSNKYPMPYHWHARCALSEDGRHLAIATRYTGLRRPELPKTQVIVFDNETGNLAWKKQTEPFRPEWVKMSPNGKHVLVKAYPDEVYLFGSNGETLKKWNLGGKVTHPTAPSGKKITVVLPIHCHGSFENNLVVLQYKEKLDTTEGLGIIVYELKE